MNLSCGIVGLANVGKSTLFNALLKKQVAASANYPFTTIEPNVGIVEVPDKRLEKLKGVVEKSEGLSASFKILPAVVKFVDIAGLVKGAHKGEGLGNQFLSHIREVDIICLVIRDFKSGDIVQTGTGNPEEDLAILEQELLFKDLETLDKRTISLEKEIRGAGANDTVHQIVQITAQAKSKVSQGLWIADNMDEESLEKIKDLNLLSAKKKIVVSNCDEGDLGDDGDEEISGAIKICAKLEEELAALPVNDQKDYLGQLGLRGSGLDRLVKKAYDMLGLITFFTAGSKEVRAWTIKQGSLAPVAAGVIHSDFEKGFIAADIVDFERFVEIGGWQKAKEAGLVKIIGRGEMINDGQVIEFKFSL